MNYDLVEPTDNFSWMFLISFWLVLNTNEERFLQKLDVMHWRFKFCGVKSKSSLVANSITTVLLYYYHKLT